jgi:hypothetical protein
MTTVRAGSLWVMAAVLGLLLSGPLFARDAAFMQPSSNLGAGDGAVRVEPKEDIDVGDTSLNIQRRVTLFFVNQSGNPVQIDKISLNSDSIVQTEITNDDCSKQGTITPASRCSIEVAITPSSPGPWSVEVLMTHNGTGRIARAKLSGKTAGVTSGDKKESGLTLTAKEATPVNFGDVGIGEKAVRSALMVNDSPEAITLYSIDVIEADNGLVRLDQGCAVDMELKPGESCPVTMSWTPEQDGQISTDLIIRHSGRLGFAVIPLRGKTTGGGTGVSSASGDGKSKKDSTSAGSGKLPMPLGAEDLEKIAAGRIMPVGPKDLPREMTRSFDDSGLHLIGTIGNRAILLLPDGSTKVAAAGEEISSGDTPIKVVAVHPKSVDLMVDGKKKDLVLGSAPELTEHATAVAMQEKSAKKLDAVKAALSNTTSAPASSTSAAPPSSTALSAPPPTASVAGSGK